MRCQSFLSGKSVPFALVLLGILSAATAQASELGAWQPGATRDRIVEFVKAAKKKGGPGFIPPEERIAVFDNDGTLWMEKPMPVELQFTIDQLRRLAPKHPEWLHTEPYRSALRGDYAYFAHLDERQLVHQLMQLTDATHSGMTVTAFNNEVKQWFIHAQDPVTHESYFHRVYQPMVELLHYLRQEGFKTYVVTGGDTDFVRAMSQQAYGIPPERVIGSHFDTQWQSHGGKFTLNRERGIVDPLNIKSGKPVNIQRAIGKIPVIAVGNSDGDLEMLQYATSNILASLQMVIRHDDAAREVAYDQGAEKLMTEARNRRWLVVSMKNDFKEIFFTKEPKQLGGEAAKE